jgi:hypothetical protein
MEMKRLTSEQKHALAKLRAIAGGVSEEKQKAQKQKHLIATREAIQKLLEAQPATIPQIAVALDMASHEVLWHVTGMRKYGQVTEAGEDGDYPLYAPVAYEDKAATDH